MEPNIPSKGTAWVDGIDKSILISDRLAPVIAKSNLCAPSCTNEVRCLCVCI
jgi:hypothetical protein